MLSLVLCMLLGITCVKYPTPCSSPLSQLSDAADCREDVQLFKLGCDKLRRPEQCYCCRCWGIFWCGKAMGALFGAPPSNQGVVLAQWWCTGSVVFAMWGPKGQLGWAAGGAGERSLWVTSLAVQPYRQPTAGQGLPSFRHCFLKQPITWI